MSEVHSAHAVYSFQIFKDLISTDTPDSFVSIIVLSVSWFLAR